MQALKSILNSNPKGKGSAKALLSLMEENGLINRSTNGYSTNYPKVIKYLLNDKAEYIFADDADMGHIADNGDNFIIKVRETPLKVNEVHSAAFQASNDEKLAKVGEGMLGDTLMSLDGIVKADEVNQTVNVIAEKISREVLSGNELTRADVDDIIDDYGDAFYDIYEAAFNASKQKLARHIGSYIQAENWENLRSMIYAQLKRRSGIIFKENSKPQEINSGIDENSIEDNNDGLDMEGADKSQGRYTDDFAITLDSKAGLSSRLKMFMSTLENGKKHYLAAGGLLDEELFEDFDTAYNTVNALLAGTEPNFEQMIAKLQEFSDYD